MRKGVVLLPAVLLVVVVFGGCVETSTSAEVTPSAEASATVDAGANAAASDELGSLAGMVTDDELGPISGAKIAIVDPAVEVTTDSLGKYSILNLKVGDYEVHAQRLGYESKAAKVKVEVGTTTEHNFILTPIAINEAYPETDHYATVMECMLAGYIWVSSCSWPYELVYLTAHKNGVNLSNYGVPPDIQKNKFRDTVTIRHGASESIVSELEWRANSALAKRMQIVNCLEYDQIEDSCLGEFARKDGETPISNMFELKKDLRPKEGKTFTYISAVWLDWGGATDLGVVLDQKFDLYNTVFYNGDPPEDFTVLAKPIG